MARAALSLGRRRNPVILSSFYSGYHIRYLVLEIIQEPFRLVKAAICGYETARRRVPRWIRPKGAQPTGG
jgi:hypothetical protein